MRAATHPACPRGRPWRLVPRGGRGLGSAGRRHLPHDQASHGTWLEGTLPARRDIPGQADRLVPHPAGGYQGPRHRPSGVLVQRMARRIAEPVHGPARLRPTSRRLPSKTRLGWSSHSACPAPVDPAIASWHARPRRGRFPGPGMASHRSQPRRGGRRSSAHGQASTCWSFSCRP